MSPPLLAVLALLLAPQQREPHIGYVFPAGARAGSTVEVWVGGQTLRGVRGARVTGGGIQVAVAGTYRPLNNQQRQALRRKLREVARRGQGGDAASRPGAATESDGVTIPPLPGVGDLEELDARGIADLQRRYFDPRRQPNAQIAETVVLRMVVARDAEPGPRELRLISPFGASNPLRFEIGSLRELREEEPNDRRAQALETGTPWVLNGQVTPGDVDRFRFHARQGATMTIAVQARALVPYLADAVPGWFQAVVTVRDPDGREIAYDDDFLFHPDPALSFRAPRTGEYVIEVRDALYRGREDFVYRLAVGELPFLEGVFPLVARAGGLTALQLQGWNLPARWLVADERQAGPGRTRVSLGEGRESLNALPLLLDDRPARMEEEPNDAEAGATSLALPVLLDGRIGAPGDVDIFRFEGRAGDRVVAEVLARRLGSPLDARLRLRDAAGELLAVADDWQDPGAGLLTHHADPRLEVELPRGGAYSLLLEDAQGHGGPLYGYRLRLGPPQPDFELRAVPSAINVPAGSAAAFTVHVLRRDGFRGEVVLVLSGAPEGFRLGGGRVPPGADSARLTLSAPPRRLAGPVALELVGRARIRGRQVERRAVPADDRMQAFLWRHLVPAQELLATVRPAAPLRTPLRLAGPGPLRIPRGGSVKVRFQGRVRGVPEGARVVLEQPPEGVTAGGLLAERGGLVLELSADRKSARRGLEGNLIIQVRADAPQASDGPRRADRADGQGRLLGLLPAVPFRIVDA